MESIIENWEKKSLGDIVTLKYGKGLPERQREPGPYPVYGSGGLVDFHSEWLVKGPGIIVGRKGSIGTVYFEKNNFFPIDTVYFVEPRYQDMEFRFIYYLLSQMKLSSLNSDTAVPGLNRDVAHSQQCLIPPLPIQRKIAAILSAYDDLIENNTRRIAILEEMAQALYREWFVHFRFPGHEKIAMVESVLGMIPEGWEVVKLGDVVDINASNIRKGHEPALINYIDIASVSPGKVDKVDAMEFANAPGRARRIVKRGDIIWSTVRPNRRSYSMILDPPENLIVSTGFAVISGKHVPYTYLYHTLTTNDFVGYLTNRATGAAYPAVNSEDFQRALIIRPSSRLLDKFHAIVAPMFDQKQNLLNKNANLRRTRDLLLPRLVAGEIDVEGMEVIAEAAAETA